MLTAFAKALKNQQGGFSPFMLGLVAGMAVFSASMRKQAEREIANIESQQQLIEVEQLEAIRSGIENMIMSEDAASFSTAITVARLQANTSTKLETRNGQPIVVNASAMDNTDGSQLIMITTSDDPFVRADVTNMTAANMQSSAINQRDDVIVISTAAYRTRQLEISQTNRATLVDFVYDFWMTGAPGARELPTNAQYNTQIRDVYNIRDFWGNHFTYNRTSAQIATISFTTPAPWSETFTQRIDLTEEAQAAGQP